MTQIYSLNLEPMGKVTDDKFYQICQKNPDLKLEINAEREILIMSPTGGETGNRNAEIITEFIIWNRQKKLGKVFDSSTCFRLPNGAEKSPDVSFITLERWEKLTENQREKFPPIAPDFVLELMSPSDNLSKTQAKMQEYIDNGVKLGWLINRKKKQVEIYTQNENKQVINNPNFLSGQAILPDFNLNMKYVW